ncbi:MAG: hypothetical protein IPM64_17165 [Phycisphaerales bacterium]|nr:hypothetical protein [Phycisphaerales bacterium]
MAKLALGRWFDFNPAQLYGLGMDGNAAGDPQPKSRCYFPSNWNPRDGRPIMFIMHGTIGESARREYYKSVASGFPSLSQAGTTGIGAIGADSNGPLFRYLAGGLVPVTQGYAQVGAPLAELSERIKGSRSAYSRCGITPARARSDCSRT